MTETMIDITPTWYELLPELLRLTAETHPEPRRHGLSELRRMAAAADRWNQIAPQLVATLEALEKACTDEGVRGMNNLLEQARAVVNTARGQS